MFASTTEIMGAHVVLYKDRQIDLMIQCVVSCDRESIILL